jgi:hypothetical protein
METKISQTQLMSAYMIGSLVQTTLDNPVTSFRQLTQQLVKGTDNKFLTPSQATNEAIQVFKKHPIQSSLSGLTPRLTGVFLKRIPKFASFLGFSYVMKEKDPSLLSATVASIVSSPFINPIRMIEKQQRVNLKTTGKIKPVMEILKESYSKKFEPLFRGTIPLIGHSLASATTGLVGQPQLQKYIEKELGTKTTFSSVTTNLISSCIVSPIYVVMTNPLSRLEVIMQTSSIKNKSISLSEAIKEIGSDMKSNGFSGLFRGQGIGMVKAIISLTTFHLGRTYAIDGFKYYNSLNNN